MPEISPQSPDVVAMSPRLRVESALAWVGSDYPRKWLRLVELCEWAMDAGYPRIRRGDLFVLAAQKGMEITLCREFRFDNNLWSVLSRYLLMFRPRLASVICPKGCALDDAGLDFEAMWHRRVAWSTCFPCATWQEAAERSEAA